MSIPTEDALADAIADAARRAIADLFRQHSGDFYYCSLVPTGEAHPPVLAAWSREALDAAVAGVLGWTAGDWPVSLLTPLLDDRRPTDRLYYLRDPNWKGPVPAPPAIPGGPQADDGTRMVPVRVCDAAAEALAARWPGEKDRFPKEPERPALDRYIARLRAKLATK